MSRIANFLYTTHATRAGMVLEGPTAEEEQILEKHFLYMKAMTEKGVVILAGRTMTNDDKAFGLVVFRADSEETARRIMQEDPGIHLGVMCAELSPFKENEYS